MTRPQAAQTQKTGSYTVKLTVIDRFYLQREPAQTLFKNKGLFVMIDRQGNQDVTQIDRSPVLHFASSTNQRTSISPKISGSSYAVSGRSCP